MTYKSNLPAIKERIRKAQDAALIAMADLGVTEMKQRISNGYYTGGEYSTGHLLGRIHRSEPFTQRGVRTILYGVSSEAMYALFWELGFYKWPSIWSESQGRWMTITRFPLKWYRKELWVPTFNELQPRFREVFAKVMASEMQTR